VDKNLTSILISALAVFMAEECTNQLQKFGSPRRAGLYGSLYCCAIGILGANTDRCCICFIRKENGRREIVGGINLLYFGVPVAHNIEVFVATAPAEQVCAAVALLVRRKSFEFFFSKFLLEDLFSQPGPFLCRSSRRKER
jgi:hypothetical protein